MPVVDSSSRSIRHILTPLQHPAEGARQSHKLGAEFPDTRLLYLLHPGEGAQASNKLVKGNSELRTTPAPALPAGRGR